VTAARTAGSCTPAAPGCGGGYGLTVASFADKSKCRHQTANVGAVTRRTIRFFIAKNKTFKILVAVFAVVLIDWHLKFSLQILGLAESHIHQFLKLIYSSRDSNQYIGLRLNTPQLAAGSFIPRSI
jgi:hypothetical protein